MRQLLGIAGCAVFAVSAFATSSMSELQANLDSNWKIAGANEKPYASATSYVPSSESKNNYTKTVVVGTIKKNNQHVAEQIKRFDNFKKQYLLKYKCDIKNLNPSAYTKNGASETVGFTYQCAKLNISGVDLTLNPKDDNIFYNLIYEFKNKTLSDQQQAEAESMLQKVKICYEGENC